MPSKVKQDSNEQLKSPDYQFSATSEFLRHCLQLKKNAECKLRYLNPLKLPVIKLKLTKRLWKKIDLC